MKAFVLLAFIPVLIEANILCPNSKTTCAEDKQCCEVDGEYSCCDLDIDQDVSAGRLKVFPGVEMMGSDAFANASSSNESMLYYESCSLLNCPGTCCRTPYYKCCPGSLSVCCDGDKCCSSLGKCCGGGCCGSLQKCCGNGCCDFGYNCCETWCCKEGSRCGSRDHTCIAKGTTISPEFISLLLMAASAFIFHRL
ncbi:unnamed protein product [Larinioides sclopetarius]|uniref:Granulin n=1 Tax=Larinioides sclopetarius TaxID=280406 RepID=A0AAV2A472_9ARAC